MNPPAPPPAPAPAGNRIAAFVLVLSVAAMAHYLSARHYWRWDASRIQFYRLSEQTREVLDRIGASLDGEPVEAILFFHPGHRGYADLENLLREYQYRLPALRVSRVDPDRNPAKARDILDRFPAIRPNAVIFSAPGRNAHRVLDAEDLFVYDLRRVTEGGRPRVSSFRGERAFTSALHGILLERPPAVYFVEGHGQRPIEDFQPREGLAELARRIRQENAEVRPLRLGETLAVPEDAALLVVAGPRRRLSQPEADLIEAYLQRPGGRLIALLDAHTDTGLEPLLGRWGIRVGDEIAVDPSRTLTGRELFVTSFDPHPITEPLAGLLCVFDRPRVVEPAEPGPSAPAADRPGIARLASTTAAGWAESDPGQHPPVFQPGADRAGPVSIAVAAEKGAPPSLDVQIRPSRVVVIGDSLFVANQNLVAANADFFLHSVRWMLDRPEWMRIPPRSTEDFQLVLTAGQVRAIGWLAMAGIPALAAALGGLQAWRRRR